MRRLALLLLPLWAGCAEPTLSWRPPAQVPAAREYGKIYERWTRTGRVISTREFDTLLIVSATLRSEEFQQAYLARFQSLYSIAAPAELIRLRAEEQVRSEAGLAFLIRAQGHNYNWADISPQRGYWRVTLIADGAEEVPATQTEQVRSRQLLEEELYGGLIKGPFSRSWHVTFPKLRGDGQPLVRPDVKKLTLRFSGPQGKTDLVWTFQ